MRQARKALIGLAASVVVVAIVMPAGAAIGSAGGSDSPVASAAKKKCKKKKRKCRKRTAPAPPAAGPYRQGRYSGTYAETPSDLFFNVAGSRLYTGPFDYFLVPATCYNSSGVGSPTYTDVVRIEPVQAFIGASGDFAGSGVWPTGSGRFIPWKVSGHIQGELITNGVFTVGPYPDFAGDPCSGTTYFYANWIGSYVVG